MEICTVSLPEQYEHLHTILYKPSFIGLCLRLWQCQHTIKTWNAFLWWCSDMTLENLKKIQRYYKQKWTKKLRVNKVLDYLFQSEQSSPCCYLYVLTSLIPLFWTSVGIFWCYTCYGFLWQDFDMPALSNYIDITPDQQYIYACGIYKPRIRCYDVSNLSMKFERCFDAEAVKFHVLSEDYSKFVVMQNDRYIEFHSQQGKWYRTRIPK